MVREPIGSTKKMVLATIKLLVKTFEKPELDEIHHLKYYIYKKKDFIL